MEHMTIISLICLVLSILICLFFTIYFKKINSKTKAFKRLQNIKDKRHEVKHFENMLFHYWKNKGSLTYTERINIAKNLLDRIKLDSEKETSKAETISITQEKNNDTAKGIFFFGMF